MGKTRHGEKLEKAKHELQSDHRETRIYTGAVVLLNNTKIGRAKEPWRARLFQSSPRNSENGIVVENGGDSCVSRVRPSDFKKQRAMKLSG
jgi:hypothetical protein